MHLLRGGDDTKLPISHTCFFSLELPDYSSYEILREKVLFAILNCQVRQLLLVFCVLSTLTFAPFAHTGHRHRLQPRGLVAQPLGRQRLSAGRAVRVECVFSQK